MEISEAPAPQDREASWQPDPLGRAPYRYWNGERWTESTSASPASIPSKAARSLGDGGLAPLPGESPAGVAGDPGPAAGPVLAAAAARSPLDDAPPPAERGSSWQPDPLNQAPYRYWNGERWTTSIGASTKSIPSRAARSLSGGGLAPPPDPRAPAPPPATVARPRVVYMEAPAARNGMALAALICAIAGVVLGLTVFLFALALILGVLAMIFGFVSRERAERDPSLGRRTMATWGVILGFVAILLGLGGAAVLATVADEDGGDAPSRELDSPHHEQSIDEELPRA